MTGESLSKGDHTRTEIIQAAHLLFLEGGFHGTSMRQIAREAGIAVGGIYNHFASKDDIFVAVLEAFHPYHEILPALQGAQGETVEAFIRDAANALIEALGKRPDFLNLMFVEIVEFNSRHMPELFASIYPEALPVVRNLLEKRGELRPIPVPVLLRAFLGLFFSYYITDLMLARQMPAELSQNSLQYFVEIFLHGILNND